MKKKPDRKMVAATLAFVVGAASAAVGPQALRPSQEGRDLDSRKHDVQKREPGFPKLSETVFTVTGGS